ncbi:MAG: hypothetical protein IJW03_03200 [Clostridia bacterium]|nr:hypothetical protein [Clostridia bacterium]
MEFYEKYFSINLSDYQNIGIDLEINKLLFAFLLATITAIIAINYIRGTMYQTVKALMRHGADCEENAKTLRELGLDRPRVRNALKSNSQLKRIVDIAGRVRYTYEEYIKLSKQKGFRDEINFDEARLYIKNEEKDLASKIFEAKSPSVIETVLMCLLMVAVFVCLMFSMPSILTGINNMLA